MNISHRCRLCLKQCKNKIDVFKDDFPKMIEILTGIMVEPYETFPAISCLDCAKNVKLALQIRKQIIKSHKVLIEEFLSRSKSQNDAVPINIRNNVKSSVSVENKVSNSEVDNSKKNVDAIKAQPCDSDDPDQNPPSPVSEPKDELKQDHRIENKSPETVVRIKKKPKRRNPPKKVTCTICVKEVQSYWLQKHIETHFYNPVTCEFCGLVSKSSTALRHHIFYYHKSAADEYMCDQCGKHFRLKYRLNLHKKKEHGGTKDFECTTCGKRFFEKMHLKRHVDKTHKNIRPYGCDRCGKSFKSINHLRVHERIHSKELPYTCRICAESFKMNLTLRSHLKSAHNIQEEEKVFCDICKRGFTSEIALKAHVNSRIHETEKCLYCSKLFTSEYMVNHLKDVHGTEI